MTTLPPAAPVTPADAPREGERIAKLLARAGIASRREVERMIEEGRIALNGVVITAPSTVLRNLAGVSVDGNPVKSAESTRIFVFHKPSGLLTAERDPAGRPTIYTALRNCLPPGTPRLMPVGRLDLNTEGLLLMTNDGEFKRALELPASGIPRTYRARTYGDISQDRLEELIEGVTIEGMQYGKIDANMERRTGRNQWIELTLTEGKNREVRRVLEHLGLEVSRLMRIRYGPFLLYDLPRGQAVEIRQVDVERFRKALLGKGDTNIKLSPPEQARARINRAPARADAPRGPKPGPNGGKPAPAAPGKPAAPAHPGKRGAKLSIKPGTITARGERPERTGPARSGPARSGPPRGAPKGPRR